MTVIKGKSRPKYRNPLKNKKEIKAVRVNERKQPTKKWKSNKTLEIKDDSIGSW